MNRRFGAIGGYDTAAALLIILLASLSAWGAFLIYRAVKGQREKRGRDQKDTGKETKGPSGDDEDWSKATGKNGRLVETGAVLVSGERPPNGTMSQDMVGKATAGGIAHSGSEDQDVDPPKTIFLASANRRKTSYDNLKEAPAEPVTGAATVMICGHDVCNAAESIGTLSKSPTEKDGKESVKDHEESEMEQHLDVDEPSETESAQELLEAKNLSVQKCQSVEDLLDNTLLTQDNGNKSNEEERQIWKTTVGGADDSLATQQQLSKTLDRILSSLPQNCLGFAVPGEPGDSLAALQLSDQGKVITELPPADIRQKKNEISIMESIMDSNEWLSTGPPDTRDLPWLTQTNFKAHISSVSSPESCGLPTEEMMSHEEKADMSQPGTTDLADKTTVVANDEMDLLNKRVGTVLPMPQLVRVSFRVHYITHSPKQILAVTGNQQELGFWESFVPLQSVEDGFWIGTVSLPMESQVEWKFLLVEEGKIHRWEECENRCFLVTGQEEEIHLNKNWGYV